jgi:23S rRNA (pseudouridine1915-N3)-methyltransferase
VKITILAVGHKLPAWMADGVAEYVKRMPSDARIDVVELKPEDRTSKTTEKVLSLEAVRIDAAIPRGATRIVCDERGAMLTTRLLAQWFTRWRAEGESPCFIIGSADGLDRSIKQSATQTIALSGCVLPHGLARVLLAEQLYRAWSLMNNHPYHRE